MQPAFLTCSFKAGKVQVDPPKGRVEANLQSFGTKFRSATYIGLSIPLDKYLIRFITLCAFSFPLQSPMEVINYRKFESNRPEISFIWIVARRY